MSKVLQFLGILFIILVCLFGALAVFAGYKESRLAAQSHAFVDTTLPAIAFDWNPKTLESAAAPELFAKTSDTVRDNFLFQLSLLGPMRKYEGSKGSASFYYTTKNGQIVTTDYVARGLFQSGEYTFNIFLIRRNSIWMIAGFHVNRS